MPLEVLHQIQYLCKNIPKVEWSGALFYTTEGSIEKPSSFKITLKTILPLNMGSQAYTEYSLDSRFIDFIEEDFEERCGWKLAHIHSHNTMPVFFSGTDMAELNDNAPAHNFYLSLIVNNYMDFMAKVAFVGEAKQDIEQVPYNAKNVNGENYIVEKQDFKVSSKKLFTFDCEIFSPKTELIVSSQFEEQVKGITKEKEEKDKLKQLNHSLNPAIGHGWQRAPQPEKKPYSDPKKPFRDWGKSNLTDDAQLVADFSWPEDIENEEEDLEHLVLGSFLKQLFLVSKYLKMKFHNIEDYLLDDILDEIVDLGITPLDLAKKVSSNYVSVYKEYFPVSQTEEFLQFTMEVIDELHEVLEYYNIVKITLDTLESMAYKFIEDDTTGHNTEK